MVRANVYYGRAALAFSTTRIGEIANDDGTVGAFLLSTCVFSITENVNIIKNQNIFKQNMYMVY